MISAHAAGRIASLALMLAAASAAAQTVSAPGDAASFEGAASKAAEFMKQAKEFGARKAKEAPPAKRAVGVLASYALEAGGSVKHNESRLVYIGQSERCYSITFSDRQGVPGYPDSYKTVISVYVNGQHVENLSNPGESTTVCGTKIQLKGFCYAEKGTSFWSAVERRP